METNCPNCHFPFMVIEGKLDVQAIQFRYMTMALEAMFSIAIRRETRELSDRISYLESQLAAKEEHENPQVSGMG